MTIAPSMAVYRRHYYEMKHTPAEVFDLLYWPLFDLLGWGLLSSFLQSGDVELPLSLGYLLGAALLWNVLYRVQNDISLTFLSDVWSRNIISLFASPITPAQYLGGALMVMGARLVVQWSIMAVLAWTVFNFGIFSLGISLIPFMIVLSLFGVAMSLIVMGVIIRVGHGANALAWGLVGLIQPLSAVYYPISILPGWAQGLSKMIPTSHIFEAMRAVLAGEPLPWGTLGVALFLDLVFLAAAVWFARTMLSTLRRRGYITRYA